LETKLKQTPVSNDQNRVLYILIKPCSISQKADQGIGVTYAVK